jgi:ubiquitin-conjugating enzyme E2 D/E
VGDKYACLDANLPCRLCYASLTQTVLFACSCAADDPLVGSIAQQYLTDKDAHDKTAADWVKRYAQG